MKNLFVKETFWFKETTVLIVMLILLSYMGCSGGNSRMPEINGTPSIHVFSDPDIEAVIRMALDKPDGPITTDELAQIEALDIEFNYRWIREEISLEDLRYCTGLTELRLSLNGIIDLSPVSDLSKLKSLVFDCYYLRDLSPLGELAELESLKIRCDSLSDLSALSGLAGLKSMDGIYKKRFACCIPLTLRCLSGAIRPSCTKLPMSGRRLILR